MNPNDRVPGGRAIGVTGGIACGKSEVGRILEHAGVAVLDTDRVAHEAMAPGQAAYRRVVDYFGRAVVAADGTIDRSRLGAVVFADPDARRALNERVHPEVRRRWRDWVARMRAQDRVAAVIIPLLYEVGADTGWDAIICVAADERVARERLMERGLGEEQIRQRWASQMPVADKVRKADYVIENNGTLDELETRTLKVLQQILSKER